MSFDVVKALRLIENDTRVDWHARSTCETAADKIEQARVLANAVGQLLDDMGKAGQSVCLAAKAQARIAFEPFRDDDNYSGDDCCMSLAEALALTSEHREKP